MRVLDEMKVHVAARPDGQISKTDADARSIATSGRGSGIVGYNVQVAVDAKHHLIVLAYNLKRVLSILGHAKTMKAMQMVGA